MGTSPAFGNWRRTKVLSKLPKGFRRPLVRRPNLVILAGPNGSGKSTVFERHLRKWSLPFVNRDVIAKGLDADNPDKAALRALRVASSQQRELLKRRQGFVTESIRPDPDLIREAREVGYKTRVLFICLETPDMNMARVRNRVARGGHSVPPGAILARYDRAIASAVQAVQQTEQLLIVDNSVKGRSPRLIARFQDGEVVSLRRNVPGWAERAFAESFEAFRANRRSKRK